MPVSCQTIHRYTAGNDVRVSERKPRQRFRWEPLPTRYLVLEKPGQRERRVVERNGLIVGPKTPESPLGGCERQRDSRRIIYNFLA